MALPRQSLTAHRQASSALRNTIRTALTVFCLSLRHGRLPQRFCSGFPTTEVFAKHSAEHGTFSLQPKMIQGPAILPVQVRRVYRAVQKQPHSASPLALQSSVWSHTHTHTHTDRAGLPLGCRPKMSTELGPAWAPKPL